METPNLFLARAQSNLSTSLCHTVDSSQKPHLWCLHLRISEILFWSLPRFMTLGKDRNKDPFQNWQLCGVWSSRFVATEQLSSRRNALALPIRVSISSFRLPSLANTTSRYLNVSNCCSVLPLTCRIPYLGFAEKHTVVPRYFSADFHSASAFR